jgi:hypothetical protein
MFNFIKNTWNNNQLYGHCLTTLPAKLWAFSSSEKLVTYTKPDSGTAERFFLIFEKYIHTNRFTLGTNITLGTNVLIFKYSELALRRVVGTALTAGSCLTLAPLGFAIKAIQTTFN